jgi:quercetin dioxygenase-like cupin family protein
MTQPQAAVNGYNRLKRLRKMKKIVVYLSAIGMAVFATAVISQQITRPEMSVRSFFDDVTEAEDGRRTGRVYAATTGLVRVEWPAGTSTTPHNHANELVLSVVSGRLRAISGDKEFVLEPGDAVVIPAWVEHSYVALEDTLTYEAAGPGR